MTWAPPPVTFFSRRRQSYSISKSTSRRQSRRILPKSVIFYLATDSGHYSGFLHSRNMVGTHQNLNGSRDLTTPMSCRVSKFLRPPTRCQPLKFQEWPTVALPHHSAISLHIWRQWHNQGFQRLEAEAMQVITWVWCKDVNRVPGPRDPKKLPDPGFQTTQKLPPRPLPHSKTTGLPAQQGQSRHCSALSETVARPSRRSHFDGLT